MISNEKINVIRVWRDNPFSIFSISDIIKLTNKSTKTWIFNTLKLLTKKGILISERKGNLNLYSLNFNSLAAFQFLQIIQTQSNVGFSHIDIISDMVNKCPLKNFAIIVFGSYAENKQTKKSDLDVCFLIENKDAEKKIKPYINDVKLNTPLQIDEHYITFNEFVEMLLADEENLGKQVFKKHKIFYNADIYYQLLKEAHKNGFRP